MSNIINIGGGAGGGGDTSKRELTWLEYEALSEAEKNNGTMYFCTDVNGDGSEFQPVIYSEEEREIGVWTDGKPLYEKSYPITNTNISTGWNILINNVSDIDTFVSGECNLTDSSSYDYSWKGSYHYNGNIAIYNFLGGAISSANGYVTIRYTKTTDTAGSGTWTPQGVPAHHYSTDEQVVGTWVDGNTIYEKTVLVQNVTLANNTTTDITISDYINNFGFPISLETLCYAQNQYLTLPYYVGGQYVIEAFFNGGTTLSVFRNGGAITVDLYFTIRYTKSST